MKATKVEADWKAKSVEQAEEFPGRPFAPPVPVPYPNSSPAPWAPR